MPAIELGTSIVSTLTWPGEIDTWTIDLVAGQTYEFRLHGFASRDYWYQLSDPFLRLFGPNGALVAGNDDAGDPVWDGFNGTDSRLVFTVATTGTYTIDVRGYDPAEFGQYLVSAVSHDTRGMNFTLDEIAWQLIDNGNALFGQPPAAFAIGADRKLTVNITGLTAEGAALAREAMKAWSNVTGIIFEEVAGSAKILFDDSDAGSDAYSNQSITGNTITSALVMVTEGWLTEFGSDFSSYSFETYIHEIGHALGLAHAGNYNGSAGFPGDIFYRNDSLAYTIMSYMQARNDEFGNPNTNVDASFRYMMTPAMADIVAIQQLYGKSGPQVHAGNTIYGFGGNSGTAALDQAVNAGASMFFCAYDEAGIDTFKFDDTDATQVINLNPESFSNVLGGSMNVSIGRNVWIEHAIGGRGGDTIYGNYLDNTIEGRNGNDRLHGGDGTNQLVGGFGNDTFVIGGTSGIDYITDVDGFDTVEFTHASTLDWTNGIYLGDIAHASFGQTYIDAYWGSAGDDKIWMEYFSTLAVTLSGNNGHDNLAGGENNDTLSGGTGNDYLRGRNGEDRLDGGTGDDTLDGGTGADTVLLGSPGLFGGWTYHEDTGQARKIIGLAFPGFSHETDTLIDVENVFGSTLGDTFYASDTQGAFFGGDGQDIFWAGATTITGIDPTSGFWITAPSNDRIDLVAGTVRSLNGLNVNGTLTITSFEEIHGNTGTDTMIGNDLANTLYGDEGSDTLTGAGGGDYLDGGTGNDTMIGGADNDRYYLDSLGDIVSEALNQGVDQVFSSVNHALRVNFENLTLQGSAINGVGNAEANIIIGNASANLLVGNGGADRLDGGLGADTFRGGLGDDIFIFDNIGDIAVELAGEGADTVLAGLSYTARDYIDNVRLTGSAANAAGNALANALTGNASANLLAGKAGNDVLTGAGGADTFMLDTALSATNIDRITDFDAPADVFRLSSAIFGAAGAGVLSAGEFRLGTAALDADDRVIYDSATGRVYYDANGNGAGGLTHFATLDTRPTNVTAADFVVI